MSQIMKEIFGDLLAVDPEKMGDTLPSPESLKFKILVKGKALSHVPNEEEESDDELAVPETPLDPTTPVTSDLTSPLLSDTASIAPSVSTSVLSEISESTTLQRPKVKLKIDPEFSKTIYLRGNHFKSFENSKRSCNHFLSFSFFTFLLFFFFVSLVLTPAPLAF